MIIVSQDKTEIVNFENIEVLGIGNPLENNNGKFAIIANAITDNQYILGVYETEERAKEVLQKIIELCKNQVNKYHYTNVLNVYEMPEE